MGDLEGGRRGAASGRKRGLPGAQRQKRRRPEYDSDDDLPHGAPRQEDYDLADDFIAPSDEELTEETDDEEEEELLDDDEDEPPRPSARRRPSPTEDEDAEGEADDDVVPPAPAETSGERGGTSLTMTRSDLEVQRLQLLCSTLLGEAADIHSAFRNMGKANHICTRGTGTSGLFGPCPAFMGGRGRENTLY